MTLQDLASVAVILGALLGVPTLIIGVIEFSRQGAQRRASHYLEQRKRFRTDTILYEIIGLLEADSPKLRRYSTPDRAHLLGMFEELALLLNSGLVTRHVAHYMFGYPALLCWKSRNFWHGLDRDSNYWALFRDFAMQMKTVEDSFSFNRRDFRF
ncbi:MAG: hypothetical protein WD906_01195 [Anaerolineales bacterium]